MARRLFWVAISTIGLIVPAAAQQAPCRSVYLLGETVPAHCRAAARNDVPVYQQWGHERPASGTGNAAPAAPLFDRRFQGGYNSMYGFGR